MLNYLTLTHLIIFVLKAFAARSVTFGSNQDTSPAVNAASHRPAAFPRA
jgi:hypothetical protein